ncbi:MAG: lipid-A-disaccharide synthase [Planctomycetes bacterium]|nr:lipid-A-disaccharide synthase [Planctomycetota bacterium]
MNPRFEVAREFARAMADLVMALPRQAAALFMRKKRLRQFAQLKHAALCELSSDNVANDATYDAANDAADRSVMNQNQKSPPRMILACGDVSGESHALHMLQHLRQSHPDLQVSGFGGARLAKAGMEVWQPLADLNVMGFRDVLAQLPLFFGCVKRFADALKQNPPDVVVLVDYPGLNRHLLRIADRAGVPVVDFIAPQLWAWAPWRISDFRKADELLTILPFEKDWYQQHGAQASYIGHPLGDGLHQLAEAEATLPATFEPDHVWVGILPGSRRSEIKHNLPLLLQAAKQLRASRPEVRFVLPHLRESVAALIREYLATSDVDVLYTPGCFHKVLPHLRAAWVASGTALLEVAAYDIPPVLVYAMPSRLGTWLAAHWLAVPWVGGLNLLAGEELAPEHLGRNLDPKALAGDLEQRLDGPVRERVLKELTRLSPAYAQAGSCQRAAERVSAYLTRPLK